MLCGFQCLVTQSLQALSGQRFLDFSYCVISKSKLVWTKLIVENTMASVLYWSYEKGITGMGLPPHWASSVDIIRIMDALSIHSCQISNSKTNVCCCFKPVSLEWFSMQQLIIGPLYNQWPTRSMEWTKAGYAFQVLAEHWFWQECFQVVMPKWADIIESKNLYHI